MSDGIPYTEDCCDEELDKFVHNDSACACGPSNPCPMSLSECAVAVCTDVCICTFEYVPSWTRCGEEPSCASPQSCDDVGACVSIAEMVNRCDDGLFCNGEERCAPGGEGSGSDGSVAGTPQEVDDGVPCAVCDCDEERDTLVQSSQNCQGASLDRRARTAIPTTVFRLSARRSLYVFRGKGVLCDDLVACTSSEPCQNAMSCQ